MSYVLTHPPREDWDHSYSILSGRICPNEPSPDYMKRFDEIICDFMKEQGVPGAALCLSLHGKQIYRQGYGISGPGHPMASSSHFRIASISKVITAIGIMRLCEKGVITLDQKILGHNGILSHIHVSKARQNDIGSITVRHLLQHSGGWDRDEDGDQAFWYQHRPHRQFLNVWNSWSLVMYVLSCPLRFPAGSKHAYSNFGYLLLGLVIEKVTRMKYEEYICNILRDIGIEDIAVGNTKKDPVNFNEVNYYNNKDPRIERSVFENEGRVVPQYGSFPMEKSAAYGGLVTSAENLVTLIDSLNADCDVPHVLSDDNLRLMLMKPSYAQVTDEAWYGLGLDVEDAGLSFGHTGAMEGTSTTVHHNRNGLTWALLMNSWSKDMDLDGLVKFALASIPGLPLWQMSMPSIEHTDYQVMSMDMGQCVRILLPHAELENHVKMMRIEGYRINHLNVLNVGRDVFFTLVWNKNQHPKKSWGIFIDVDLRKFERQLANMRKFSMKVTYLEPYRLAGQVRHICLYEKSASGSQTIYCIRDEKKHLERVLQYQTLGYELRSQSYLYGANDTLSITAVYDKIPPSVQPVVQNLWMGLPIEHFVERLGTFVGDRLRIEYLKFCSTPDMPKISAIWSKCRPNKEKRLVSCRHKSCEINVFQRHDVSKYGFLFELRESMKNNRRVLFLSAYESEGVIYFATIWRATTVVPSKKNTLKRRNHKPSQEVRNSEERPYVAMEHLEQVSKHNVELSNHNMDLSYHNVDFMCLSDSALISPDLDASQESNNDRTEADFEAELHALNIKIEKVESDPEEENLEVCTVKSESTDSSSEFGDDRSSQVKMETCMEDISRHPVTDVKIETCMEDISRHQFTDVKMETCIEDISRHPVTDVKMETSVEDLSHHPVTDVKMETCMEDISRHPVTVVKIETCMENIIHNPVTDVKMETCIENISRHPVTDVKMKTCNEDISRQPVTDVKIETCMEDISRHPVTDVKMKWT